MKQMHKQPQYMNTDANKQKRRDNLIQLQQYQAMGKTIIYITRGRSLQGHHAVKRVFAGGGENMHVIGCISEQGLVYYEVPFGSNRHKNTNEFIRRFLRHVRDSTEFDLSNMALVLDIAPCHCRAERVFEETEFLDATLLRLGSYSPMLNPIENEFSAFKSAVKAFMTEYRRDILDIPAGVTMKDHHQSYVQRAVHRYLPGVTTLERCQAFYTLRFHTTVCNFEDKPGGM
jgi:transposase